MQYAASSCRPDFALVCSSLGSERQKKTLAGLKNLKRSIGYVAGTVNTTTATAAAIGATPSSLRYLPSLHYHLLERAETYVVCSCISSSSTRRRWPPASVLPHAAADSTATACARASIRSHVAVRHHRRHNTAHARAPAIASSTQVYSCSRSLHRTGVARITAHAPRRCRYSAPRPCSLQHARSFLSYIGLLSFVLLWPALFSSPFRGTSRHASSRARFSRHVSPRQHARARRAHTDDAQRRTMRRAVRRIG